MNHDSDILLKSIILKSDYLYLKLVIIIFKGGMQHEQKYT